LQLLGHIFCFSGFLYLAYSLQYLHHTLLERRQAEIDLNLIAGLTTQSLFQSGNDHNNLLNNSGIATAVQQVSDIGCVTTPNHDRLGF